MGAFISVPGLLLRGYSAGFIHKDQELATGGPYHHMRHPLYLGSFLLGFGLALAGGRWWFSAVFAGLFIWIYRRTVRAEESELADRFGAAFEVYRLEVPPFLPTPRRRESNAPSPGFRTRLYRRNKEWQALVGAAMGYGLLWGKTFFLS